MISERFFISVRTSRTEAGLYSIFSEFAKQRILPENNFPTDDQVQFRYSIVRNRLLILSPKDSVGVLIMSYGMTDSMSPDARGIVMLSLRGSGRLSISIPIRAPNRA